MHNPVQTLIGLLAPLICQGCGVEGVVICDECHKKIQRVPSRCYRCHKATKDFATCPTCRRKTALRRVQVLAPYESVIVQAIHALKYERVQNAAKELVMLAPTSFAEGTVFVAVPTTPQRRRIRGYDQAVLLAKGFANNCPGTVQLLLHRVSKNHQVGASGVLRRKQLAGAFTVSKRVQKLPAHVVLVDDVLTTGATMEEAAKTLRNAGVVTIDAVVIAQA